MAVVQIIFLRISKEFFFQNLKKFRETKVRALVVAMESSSYAVRFVNILALITGISTLICMTND